MIWQYLGAKAPCSRNGNSNILSQQIWGLPGEMPAFWWKVPTFFSRASCSSSPFSLPALWLSNPPSPLSSLHHTTCLNAAPGREILAELRRLSIEWFNSTLQRALWKKRNFFLQPTLTQNWILTEQRCNPWIGSGNNLDIMHIVGTGLEGTLKEIRCRAQEHEHEHKHSEATRSWKENYNNIRELEVREGNYTCIHKKMWLWGKFLRTTKQKQPSTVLWWACWHMTSWNRQKQSGHKSVTWGFYLPRNCCLGRNKDKLWKVKRY